MKKGIIAVAVIIGVAGCLGLVWFLTTEREEDRNETDVDLLEFEKPSVELLKRRGERPENTRLRKGNRQIEDGKAALDHARDAMSRVERELSAASSAEERAELEKKKALIQKSIDGLVEK